MMFDNVVFVQLTYYEASFSLSFQDCNLSVSFSEIVLILQTRPVGWKSEFWAKPSWIGIGLSNSKQIESDHILFGKYKIQQY